MAESTIRTRRWTRREYSRLIDVGVLHEDDPIELLEGRLVVAEPQHTPHATAIDLAGEALRQAFGAGWRVRIQLPLGLGPDSEPEPDVAVVRGDARDFLADHPATAALVVEVSDAGLELDRRLKARIYARARITDYWVVNLVDRVVGHAGYERSELGRFSDGGGGAARHRGDHVVERHAEGEELRHQGAQVVDDPSGRRRVQVGADGGRQQALRDGPPGDFHVAVDRRVSHVQHDAALLRRSHGSANAAVGAEHLLGIAIEDVRGDVALAKVLEDLVERERRVRDVHHQSDTGEIGRLSPAPQPLARVGLVPLPGRAVGDA